MQHMESVLHVCTGSELTLEATNFVVYTLNSMPATHQKYYIARGVDNFFDVGGADVFTCSEHINLRYFVCMHVRCINLLRVDLFQLFQNSSRGSYFYLSHITQLVLSEILGGGALAPSAPTYLHP